MASSYSSRIRLEKQGAGENANTWGDRLNQNVVSLVDAAIAGVTAVDVDGLGGTGITLTENDGAVDQGRHAGLRFTGDLDADVTVTYGASEKIYFVNNETTGDHKIIMDNGSTKVSVAGGSALIATQGSNSFTLRDFESGTRMLFEQDSAPEGWTVVTDSAHNNAALRIVNAATSGAQVGGSNQFTSVFNTNITVSVTGATNSATLTGTTSATVLTTAQIPSHSHSLPLTSIGPAGGGFLDGYPIRGTGFANTGTKGGSQGHTHSLAGKGSHSHTGVSAAGSFNLDVKYINFIVCEKD